MKRFKGLLFPFPNEESFQKKVKQKGRERFEKATASLTLTFI